MNCIGCGKKMAKKEFMCMDCGKAIHNNEDCMNKHTKECDKLILKIRRKK